MYCAIIIFLTALLSVACAGTEASISKKCTNLVLPDIPGFEILSVAGTQRHDFTVEKFRIPYVLQNDIEHLEFCNITVTLTHQGTNDEVKVAIWLPLKGWNGRFLATGGGGYSVGVFDPLLGKAIARGYAAASTDGGVIGTDMDPKSWVLGKNGSVNLQAVRSFGSTAVKDMAAVGKVVTEQYYGVKPHHSYFSGCSNGGRQGYMTAQRYPEIFDGILAEAPALNFPSLQMSSIWAQVVMQQENTFPSLCEFEYFKQRAISDCDMLDGVEDGVLIDPSQCDFDPFKIVGESVQCEGSIITISNATAGVIRQILNGPTTPYGDRLFSGVPQGCSFRGFAGTKVVEGVRVGNPFPISVNWVHAFLLNGRDFDFTKIDYEDYAWLFSQSLLQYEWILGSNNPDLSGLKASKGKLLSWTGMLDALIPYKSIVEYRERVESEMGGADVVDEFYRLFLAPGVEHCGFGPGPEPRDPLAALVSWVEDGIAPDTLEAKTNGAELPAERNLCRHNFTPRYHGKGDPSVADSWICEKADKARTRQPVRGWASKLLQQDSWL